MRFPFDAIRSIEGCGSGLKSRRGRAVSPIFSLELALGLALSLLYTGPSRADMDWQADGLFQALAGRDLNDVDALRATGLKLGGWVAAGANYNPAHPADGSNAPVSFNDRANEFNLEQLDLFIERPVSGDSNHWEIGGRFDFMFGLDAPYTQATGHWDMGLVGDRDLRRYKIALPQLYAEVYAPVGKGLSAKIGHFYSILGYESVAAPLNFFYSHSYSMKSSPFTHTGALLSYPLLDGLRLYSGAVAGADNFDQDFGAWSYLGGIAWENPEKSVSFAFSALQGDASERIRDTRSYLSAFLQYRLTDKLRYTVQHDRGRQDRAFGAGTKTAEWYSIVQYLAYAIDDSFGLGLRAEWFRDQNGFRYAAGEASYYALSLGANWKPMKWLTVRPEIRYDWADSASRAYAAGTENSQFLVGADFVVLF